MTGYILWTVTGVFICFLGFMVFSGRYDKASTHGAKACCPAGRQTKDLALLGVLTGMMPCMPLAGVLSYISMVSTRFTHGIFLGLSFGIGVLISPLILMSILAGFIPRLGCFNPGSAGIILHRLCGTIIMVMGFHILIKIFRELALTI
jgi:sulfite exporter TauE/SafE